MSLKPIIWLSHARTRMGERGLLPAWVERTVREPEWTTPDPDDAEVERRYRGIADFGGRVLRVACVETSADIRIVSVLPDRNARRRRP